MGAGMKLLTIEEVADRLRVSVLTVRWLRQEGRFIPAIKVGRRLVWDTRDVDAWLEAQRETRMQTTRDRTKVPGSGRVLGGAAYRNRTDDLRITRGTIPNHARASCTDGTGYRTDGPRGAGIIR